MKKHLNTQLAALHVALAALSDDLYATYWANYEYDRPEDMPESPEQLQLHAMAKAASEMELIIRDAWQFDRKELKTHLANPDYEPIHAVLSEILAVKEQAAARHRQRKADEAQACFKLQARFHSKGRNHV